MTDTAPDEVAETAERLFLEALAKDGARDPREFYRGLMKQLREANPAGYEAAVAYYGNTLLPSVASGTSEPLGAWLDYGRVIVEATAPGETVEIDEDGRRTPYAPPTPRNRLVLHLPETGHRALLVGLPRELSTAQRSTFDLMVQGKLKLQNS